VADNINEIEEFGDLPEDLLHCLSQILTKRRVLTSRTLDLFLRSDMTSIEIYDCGSTSEIYEAQRYLPS
jgi:DNA repair protein RAD7